MIDLRSDTVTKPSKGMLEAMFSAPLGDDVYGEDPSINALEQKVADIFGFETAVFCPSGTMTNQIAIKTHTIPGDEVICDATSHIYNYEGGGMAFNSGVQVRAIHGTFGKINATHIEDNIHPPVINLPRTSLVALENTLNKAGGGYYTLKEIAAICSVQKKMTTHTARHTFATTVTLGNGVPMESVSKMLGHKNLKTTQHYAKVLDKKISDDMNSLREKILLKNNSKLKAI